MRLSGYLSLADFESAARRRLPRAVYGFVSGGSEQEQSLQENRAAFARLGFLPRGLRGADRRDPGRTLWGRAYQAPFGIAPMGIAGMCRQGADLDLARAAHAAGLPFILSGSSNVPLEDILPQAPGTWYQGYFPGDTARLERILQRLRAARVEVLVVTIDTCVAGNRENNARRGFTVPFALSPALMADGLAHPRWLLDVFARTLATTGVPRWCNLYEEIGCRITEEPAHGFRTGRDLLGWEHIAWLRERWPGPLVVKGVMHPDDARQAVRHRLDGVIVSNHGGRQLDGALAPLQVLPEIVAAVPQGFPVMVDGGFRRGSDVLKAVALGARMVFVGRPFMYATAVGGQPALAHAIGLLRAEIERDMALLGCASLDELTGAFLRAIAGAAAASPSPVFASEELP